MKKKLSLISFLCLVLSAPTYASISIKMTPNDVNAMKGQSFGARSGYEIKIYNETNDVQIYEYHATLCPELNKCEKQDRTNIKVLPKDWFVENFSLGTMVRYNNAKTYVNRADVVIGGFENTHQYKIAYFNII